MVEHFHSLDRDSGPAQLGTVQTWYLVQYKPTLICETFGCSIIFKAIIVTLLLQTIRSKSTLDRPTFHTVFGNRKAAKCLLPRVIVGSLREICSINYNYWATVQHFKVTPLEDMDDTMHDVCVGNVVFTRPWCRLIVDSRCTSLHITSRCSTMHKLSCSTTHNPLKTLIRFYFLQTRPL